MINNNIFAISRCIPRACDEEITLEIRVIHWGRKINFRSSDGLCCVLFPWTLSAVFGCNVPKQTVASSIRRLLLSLYLQQCSLLILASRPLPDVRFAWMLDRSVRYFVAWSFCVTCVAGKRPPTRSSQLSLILIVPRGSPLWSIVAERVLLSFWIRAISVSVVFHASWCRLVPRFVH